MAIRATKAAWPAGCVQVSDIPTGDDSTLAEAARRLVGERCKVYDGGRVTAVVTLAEFVGTGGCDFRYATFHVTDETPGPVSSPSPRRRCRECGVPGDVDGRGFGLACGCALE